jgi:hypothetical protein
MKTIKLVIRVVLLFILVIHMSSTVVFAGFMKNTTELDFEFFDVIKESLKN